MTSYSPETLKHLQIVLTRMMDVFVRVCNKYKIKYFVIFGTAIGCVRHHGFIPWDDDIDVGIMWKDYLLLRSIPKSEWADESNDISLVLCDPSDNNEDHEYPYPRLYCKDTTLIPESDKSLKPRKRNNTGISYNGFWIDLFIFHNFANLREITKVKKKAILLRKKYLYCKKKKEIRGESGIIRKVLAIFQNLYNLTVNFFYKNPEIKIWKKYCSLFYEKGDVISTVDYPYSKCPEKSALSIDDLFPLVDGEFNKIKVKLPKEYDRFLKKVYGDYMKLPPAKEQINHAPYVLKFKN